MIRIWLGPLSALNTWTGRDLRERHNSVYSEVSVIAVNGDRDHPRKLKIREVAAPLKKCLKTYIGVQDTPLYTVHHIEYA